MEDEEKDQFKMTTVFLGLIGILVVGGLGTYIYFKSLRYEINNSAKNDQASLNNNTNVIPLVDSDNDGLIDAREEFYGTDPLNPDTDGDGFSDGFEVINGYNPKGEGKLEIYVNQSTDTNS